MPTVLQIAKDAEKLVKKYNSRDPFVIADALGINIMPLESVKLAACYRDIKRNYFIFLSENLCEEDAYNALCRELGHYIYHKSLAKGKQGLLEFSLYNMTCKVEREANLFGAALRIDDGELLDLIHTYGYTIQQCARELGTNEAYVALKCDILIEQGHELYPQEYDRNFWNR